MRSLLISEILKVSGGNIDIKYSTDEIVIKLDNQNDTVVFNKIGFGWLGWSQGGSYNHQQIATESEFNGYKIIYNTNAGNYVTFNLTPLK